MWPRTRSPAYVDTKHKSYLQHVRSNAEIADPRLWCARIFSILIFMQATSLMAMPLWFILYRSMMTNITSKLVMKSSGNCQVRENQNKMQKSWCISTNLIIFHLLTNLLLIASSIVLSRRRNWMMPPWRLALTTLRWIPSRKILWKWWRLLSSVPPTWIIPSIECVQGSISIIERRKCSSLSFLRIYKRCNPTWKNLLRWWVNQRQLSVQVLVMVLLSLFLLVPAWQLSACSSQTWKNLIVQS